MPYQNMRQPPSKTAVTPFLSRLDAIPDRIEACESQAYHLSSFIQPHAIFLACDPASHLIRMASRNAELVWGQPSEALIGTPMSSLFAARSGPRIASAITEVRDDPAARRSVLVLDLAPPLTIRVHSFLYASSGLACLEIELPRPETEWHDVYVLYARFFAMVERIGHAETQSERLATIACEAIRGITGFDRIYFCQFGPNGHGHVLGESSNSTLPSLWDHRFPASDVPQAMRRLYVINRFRLIPDIDAQPLPVIGAEGTALDLTLSFCRAAAPTHLQYLRNMGVQASVSFSMVTENGLEAIFGGHNATPRLLPASVLISCQHLVELFRTRLDFLKLREESRAISLGMETLHALSGRFRVAEHDLGGFIAANARDVCALMHADDVLCRFEETAWLGNALEPDAARAVLDCLSRKLATGMDVFCTDCLGELDAAFSALLPRVAGALAVALDLARSNILVWLRTETPVTERWSGDPHHPAIFDQEGIVGPRTSFAAYLHEIRGTCLEWSLPSINLARQLRHAFSQVLASRYESGMRAAAEQANILKSEFVATIGHELRTPLHAINGLSSVLAAADDTLDGEKRRNYARTIHGSGERLLRLIDDLLDLSRLEAGKMNFDFVSSDMVHTISGAIAEVTPLAEAKGIAIDFAHHHQSGICRHDPARMRQVLINLLSNALKVSSVDETISVSLDITQPGTGGALAVIQVADQGPGIPESELHLVFDSFVQSSRVKSGAGGTGLGLTISREIVQAHRGRIWALNNRTGGVSLFVSLPFIDESGGAARP